MIRSEELGLAALAAADNADIGIAIVFHEADGPHTSFVNDAALRITGRTRDELCNTTLLDFLDDESRARVRDFSRRRREGLPVEARVEATLVRPDGARVPIAATIGLQAQVGGRAAGFGFFWDISDRVNAERACLVEAQRLTRVVESAPDGVALVRAGRILQVNPAGARMLGFDDPQQVVGVSLSDLMLPEEVPMMIRRMQASAQGVRQAGQIYRVHRRDGSIISAEVSSIPFEHEGAPALLAFVRDVTDRAQLHEQMARTERLAALSTLAAGLAHEVNNPLTAAMLQVDVIEQHAAAAIASHVQTDLFERIAELRKTHERIATVMRDFSLFARAGEVRRERVDLKTVIGTVERMLMPLMSRHGRYVNELPDLPQIDADAGRLEQVFLNLMMNAAQALPEGREGNEVRVRGRRLEDGRVAIEVIDNGVGIPSDNLRRVFDPFFTTKPVGIGTGLGLTVCHNIITSYGGDIEIDSVAGRGCTMRVLLPATPPAPRPVVGRPRVMIVDDEPHLASTLRLLLQDRHEVEMHTQSEQAVRTLLGGARVDVVLCDLMMPDPNGIEVFRRVTAGRPELKDRFIFMTGGVYTAASQLFLESTVAPRVEKPFDPETVERLIATIAAR